MKIKEITSQYRRDIHYIAECEHCGHVTEEQIGYDDAYFHSTVVPDMECPECKEKAPKSFRGLAPKYSDYEIV